MNLGKNDMSALKTSNYEILSADISRRMSDDIDSGLCRLREKFPHMNYFAGHYFFISRAYLSEYLPICNRASEYILLYAGNKFQSNKSINKA